MFPDGVCFYPVSFHSDELPFPIAGMSDTMPYESSIYSEMTPHMLLQLRTAFLRRIREAVAQFSPDVLLCHHLFWLTAWVREAFPQLPVFGLCHGTDLRQLLMHPENAPLLAPAMRGLDGVFSLHAVQREAIAQQYGIPESSITVIGTGYNDAIFYRAPAERFAQPTIVYAGKLSEKKGVLSLLHSMALLQSGTCLKLAGSAGSQAEDVLIHQTAERCGRPVTFLGHMTQSDLAQVFRQSHVFVLPSFYEGLPLVLMEALACGLQVVCSDLPGIRPWMQQQIPENPIRFVTPPPMRDGDTPLPQALPAFEAALAAALDDALTAPQTAPLDFRHLSWHGVCEKICARITDKLSIHPSIGGI